MDLPINIELNFAWLALIVSFVILPLILLVFKRWLVVIVQTALIASLSLFVAFLSFQNISIDGNTILSIIFYVGIGLYISVGVYGLIDGIHRAVT